MMRLYAVMMDNSLCILCHQVKSKDQKSSKILSLAKCDVIKRASEERSWTQVPYLDTRITRDADDHTATHTDTVYNPIHTLRNVIM